MKRPSSFPGISWQQPTGESRTSQEESEGSMAWMGSLGRRSRNGTSGALCVQQSVNSLGIWWLPHLPVGAPGEHLPFSKAVTNRKLFPGPEKSLLIRSQALQVLAWVWSWTILASLFCRVRLETKTFCSKSFTLSQRKIIVPVWAFQQQKHLNGFHYISRTWWKVWARITSTGPWICMCQSSFRVEGGEGDLMIRNNCHCTLNRDRWHSQWLWKCILPNCSKKNEVLSLHQYWQMISPGR